MIRSMTGFSTVSGDINSINFIIQLRSENSKNLEIIIYDKFNNYKIQEKIKNIVKKNFTRGKIRVSLDYYYKDSFNNESITKELYKFVKLANKFNINPTISITELVEIMNKDIIIKQSSDKSIRFQMKLLDKGIKYLISSQKVEGKNLIIDVKSKLNKINKIKEQIIKRTRAYKISLEKKYTKEILNNIPNIDSIDIKKEIINAIDRIDIEEEIIRLNSHVTELKKLIGKKQVKGLIIDFYMQEINREANTISSKSKDAKLSEMAIEIKTYLNQIREIAANLS